MEPKIIRADHNEDRSGWPEVLPGEVAAYVDGSFNPELGRYAYGCVLFCLEAAADSSNGDQAVGAVSMPHSGLTDPEEMAPGGSGLIPVRYELSGYGDDPETAQIRNIAGEMLGAMHATVWAMKRGARAVEIRYDYQGIEMWAERRWKRKNPLTQKYSDAMNRWREKIEIRFQKVEAHSGDRWNNAADKLAKAALLYEEDV